MYFFQKDSQNQNRFFFLEALIQQLYVSLAFISTSFFLSMTPYLAHRCLMIPKKI